LAYSEIIRTISAEAENVIVIIKRVNKKKMI